MKFLDVTVKYLDIRQVRKYKKRKQKPINPLQVIKFFSFWTGIILFILYLLPDRAWELKMHGFFVIAAIGIWRYSWQIVNFIQSLIYEKYYYPKLKKIIKKLPITKRYPKRVFFIIPSYHEDPKVSKAVFKYLVEECYKIPSQVYFYVSVGSKEEARLIDAIVSVHDIDRRIIVKFLYQKMGKRVAFYHALRAVAREFYKPSSYHKDYKNDVLILMDGDSVVGKDVLKELLPFFKAFQNLGAMTTDEDVYYYGDNLLVDYWYRLKFARRDIMMKSHALHKRVLTLTGRFSAFRAYILLNEEFINMMAKDHLEHWLFGKFRFLMGDDKTTWFYLLKNKWDMLYAPDLLIFSVENRGGNFFKVSTSLMVRWYGNMLRNNFRALKLGPKNVGGFFIWYAILDQRISMWTSLVGPTVATLLSLFISPFFWVFYLAWAIFIRMLQMLVLVTERINPYIVDLLLILYDQWVGSVIKIYASYNLAKQKWAKGKSQSVDINIDTFPIVRKYLPYVLILVSAMTFIFLMGIYSGVFKLPNIKFILFKQAKAEEINKDYSIIIQSLIDKGKTTITLPEGKIHIYNPIVIKKSNLKILGNNTTIISHLKTKDKAVFIIEGEKPAKIATVTKNTKKGSYKIPVKFLKQVNNLKFVWLGSPNTEKFLNSINSRVWKKKYPYLRQDIIKVEKLGKNYIYLQGPLEFDLDKGSPIRVPRFVENITIKNIKILQEVKNYQNVKFIYKNLYPKYKVDGIYINWGYNIKLENMEFIKVGSNPIYLHNSKNIQMNNIKVLESLNKGKGGNGYIRFSKTFDSKLSNCYVEGIRHLVFQWGSSRNIVENCYFKVDINFHGGFDRNNIVKNCTIDLPKNHPWKPIEKTPFNAKWAPPDGGGNKVLNCKIILN